MADINSQKRQDRLEYAIERLTEISNTLEKIIAVHEQRISQQEKDSEFIFKAMEKNKDDIDQQMKDIYIEMNDQEKKIFEEISKFRKETNEQYNTLNQKISQIEKFNWIAIGGGIVISWILTNLSKFLIR